MPLLSLTCFGALCRAQSISSVFSGEMGRTSAQGLRGSLKSKKVITVHTYVVDLLDELPQSCRPANQKS